MTPVTPGEDPGAIFNASCVGATTSNTATLRSINKAFTRASSPWLVK